MAQPKLLPTAHSGNQRHSAQGRTAR